MVGVAGWAGDGVAVGCGVEVAVGEGVGGSWRVGVALGETVGVAASVGVTNAESRDVVGTSAGSEVVVATLSVGASMMFVLAVNP
jgi:hypothetical protein